MYGWRSWFFIVFGGCDGDYCDYCDDGDGFVLFCIVFLCGWLYCWFFFFCVFFILDKCCEYVKIFLRNDLLVEIVWIILLWKEFVCYCDVGCVRILWYLCWRDKCFKGVWMVYCVMLKDVVVVVGVFVMMVLLVLNNCFVCVFEGKCKVIVDVVKKLNYVLN